MNKRIPTTVVTGFLGAGKTTLIQHLIRKSERLRLALIINEFGDLGIDKELLIGCGIEGCTENNVVELSNGCLCCTVADEFLPTMEMLLARAEPPDHIIIETSGLALPKPLIMAFNWPEIRSRITVDGVITVVDAPSVSMWCPEADLKIARVDCEVADKVTDKVLDHDSPLEELFEDQLACADIVILNKCDLISAITLHAVKAMLKAKIRDRVRVITTVYGDIDSRIVLGLCSAVEDNLDTCSTHHDDSHNHNHDDFESFSIELGPISNPAILEAKIKQISLAYDILRIKGFLDVPGKPMRHVLQAVGPRIERYFDRPWKTDEARQSRLVIIGPYGMNKREIETVLVG